jgi:hypothetical protein
VLAGLSAPLGHEQGERLIGGILECRTAFQNGSVPLGIDPELDDDAATVKVRWMDVAGDRCWQTSGILDAKKLAAPAIARIGRMVEPR